MHARYARTARSVNGGVRLDGPARTSPNATQFDAQGQRVAQPPCSTNPEFERALQDYVRRSSGVKIFEPGLLKGHLGTVAQTAWLAATCANGSNYNVVMFCTRGALQDIYGKQYWHHYRVTQGLWFSEQKRCDLADFLDRFTYVRHNLWLRGQSSDGRQP